MTTETFDAIVVGARVAGAPTAMLLARAGHHVLLVDRDTFPSDIMSTHYIHQPGVAALKRWGVLDEIVASGCPPITTMRYSIGPLTLEGFGPPSDGCHFAYAPRRTVLDKTLVDAAAKAGVEVREGFSVQQVLKIGDTVTGIAGRDRDGTTVVEQAQMVVGADGMHSIVARTVAARRYHEKPALACYYYAYWSGVEVAGVQGGVNDGCNYIVIPTNDGQVVVAVGLTVDRFQEFRADIEGTYLGTLRSLAPDLLEQLQTGRRQSRFFGTADLPNFFRRPYGPGWALVGDAGYHKDPITGYGITDAFRDAEWLAEALDAGLSGRRPLMETLAEYETRRNTFALPMYDLICALASMEPPSPQMQALFTALAGDREATGQFYGVLDGTVSAPEFFAEENIERIMARASARDKQG